MSEAGPETERLLAEKVAIRDEMINLLHTWAAIENRLANLLREIIGDKTGEVAFAIYFAPSSMEVRFQIVDSAMRALVDEKSHADFYVAWNRILSSIQRGKNMRNAVAHGAIGTAYVNGSNHVRLLPPIFDFKRLIPKKRGQTPGYGSNELRQSTEALSKKLKSLDLVSEWLAATKAGDLVASKKIFAELETHLQTLAGEQPQPSKA